MPAQIRILGMRNSTAKSLLDLPMEVKESATVINPCSNSPTDWQSDLSPFKLGPVNLFGDLISQNMENGWQYTKVYKQFIDDKGHPKDEYFKWAASGWNNPRAVRYPMGRGAKPEYSYWDGQYLGYIEARKKIYGPLYSKAVVKTAGFTKLKELYEKSSLLVIRDFDGYDHVRFNMSLTDVLNSPVRKMGHAFVLAMLLLNDPALQLFV